MQSMTYILVNLNVQINYISLAAGQAFLQKEIVQQRPLRLVAMSQRYVHLSQLIAVFPLRISPGLQRKAVTSG